MAEIKAALLDADLTTEHLILPDGSGLTPMGATLMDYLAYRGNVLNTYAEPHLMDVDRAREVFEQVHSNWPTTRKIPMNKQKEEKANYAYFTAIINMLIEQHSAGLPATSIRNNLYRLSAIMLRYVHYLADWMAPSQASSILWQYGK